MSKKLFLILIVVTTLLGFNAINHSSIHAKRDAIISNKSHLVCNLPVNTINTFNFITKIEDDLNEDKFQAALHYPCVANYSTRKIKCINLNVGSINSQTDYTNLYRGIPLYVAIGSYRI